VGTPHGEAMQQSLVSSSPSSAWFQTQSLAPANFQVSAATRFGTQVYDIRMSGDGSVSQGRRG